MAQRNDQSPLPYFPGCGHAKCHPEGMGPLFSLERSRISNEFPVIMELERKIVETVPDVGLFDHFLAIVCSSCSFAGIVEQVKVKEKDRFLKLELQLLIC